MVTEIKRYQLKNILIKFLKDINNLKKSDTWKIQLTIANNFISMHSIIILMHSRKDNTETMINDEIDEVIE